MNNKNKTTRKSLGLKKGILISLAIVLVSMVFIVGYLLDRYNQFGNNIYSEQDPNNTDEVVEQDSNAFGITDLFSNTFTEPITILALGLDAKEGESLDTARSDTIMLVTLNPDTKQVATVSFPRDSYVWVEDVGYTKLNHAVYYGGVPLLEQTIEENFGIEIDHYAAIDFVAFTELVDILGGLEVYTPSSMYYKASDIDVELTPGYHQLNGEELLGYVRYRHDESGDIGRISRQQYVIRALGEKAVSLKGVLKAPQILDSLGDHMMTDLSKTDILSIAKAYRNFSNEDWHPLTLQGVAARSDVDNLWYYFYEEEDKEQIKQHIEDYKTGKK